MVTGFVDGFNGYEGMEIRKVNSVRWESGEYGRNKLKMVSK